ncbi:hypothetical protein CEXT_522081 [Caerostris extrusa]|uniref:Uncharacterized protein n=1 Tax=Caerostris extrusa TaxID=172846 RepID=A0AAV4XZC9_CAEEX|nr:hypothetical protein CEXT_522081 [Caerostris extrusa]
MTTFSHRRLSHKNRPLLSSSPQSTAGTPPGSISSLPLLILCSCSSFLPPTSLSLSLSLLFPFKLAVTLAHLYLFAISTRIKQATSRTAPNTRHHWSSIFGQMGNLVPNPCGIATIDSDSPLLRQTQPPTPVRCPPLPLFWTLFNLPVPPVFPPYWSHTADSSARIIHRACAVASYRSIVVQVQGS